MTNGTIMCGSVACNWSGLGNIALSANNATNGAMGALLLAFIWIVAFAYTSPYGFPRSFTNASVLAFFCGIPLYALGVVSGYVEIIFLVLSAIGVFMLFISR